MVERQETLTARELTGFTDEELVTYSRNAKDQDVQRTALDELFGRYQRRVALWCYRITGNRESAADLAQDVLLRAYRHLDNFRAEAKFSTWLYTVARNHCINEAVARANRPEQSLESAGVENWASYTEAFEAQIDRDVDTRRVREFLNRNLDETELTVMTLHYSDEMTLDAITRLLGLSNASGAKAYIVSARRKLSAAVARWRKGATGK